MCYEFFKHLIRELLPWKAPVWAPWCYTYLWKLDFSMRVSDIKMDKRQAWWGQTPGWLRVLHVGCYDFFFFPFSWIFHPALTHSQHGAVTGESFLGRAKKLKTLTLKWESPFSHANTAQCDVRIQLGINGSEQKIFPKLEKIMYCCWIASFLS